MDNAKNCILAGSCSLAGSDSCHVRCPSFIAMHGTNGNGGRVANANLPDEYKRVTLANSPARSTQESAYKLVDAYGKTFTRQFGDTEEGGRIKSLYLYSASPGTG